MQLFRPKCFVPNTNIMAEYKKELMFINIIRVAVSVSVIFLLLSLIGCARDDEKILRSSESILRNRYEDIKKEAREAEGNNGITNEEYDWVHTYLLPGHLRGLEALRKVRGGDKNLTAMMTAALRLNDRSNIKSGKLIVYFIHPPGYTDIKGIYIETPDGEKQKFLVVKDHDHVKRNTWLRYVVFPVVIDNQHQQKNKDDSVHLELWHLKPIYLSRKTLNKYKNGATKVGIIMPNSSHIDAVPMCICYEPKNKESEE